MTSGSNFLNDAYGGSADKDRNLYVNSIEVNGVKLLSQDAIYDRNGIDLPGQTAMPWVGALVFDVADHNGFVAAPSADTATATAPQTIAVHVSGKGISDLPGQTVMPWAGALVFDVADRNGYVTAPSADTATATAPPTIAVHVSGKGISDLPGQTVMPWAGALVFDVADRNGYVTAPSADTTTATAPQTIAVHVSGKGICGLSRPDHHALGRRAGVRCGRS